MTPAESSRLLAAARRVSRWRTIPRNPAALLVLLGDIADLRRAVAAVDGPVVLVEDQERPLIWIERKP